MDRNGYTTTLAYTGGVLSSVTDPAGRSLTVTDNTSHRIATVSDGTRSESFTYDGNGNLTDIVDVGGGHWHFTYDSNHLLLTMEDPRQYAAHGPLSSGPVTTNVYNSANQVTSQTDPMGRTTTFGYVTNADGTETTTITDPKGNVETNTYANYELQADTEGVGSPQAATRTYTYDPNTRGTTAVTDPDGHVTKGTYDARGNLLTQTDPLNHTTTYTYDSLNDVTSVTDPSNVTSTLTYDSTGNLLSASRPLTSTSQTATTSFTYGDSSHPGDVTSVTDPNSHVTQYAYDTYGDLTKVTDPNGNITTYNYDSVGRPTTSVLPKGNVSGGTPSQYTYQIATDAYGEVTQLTDPRSNIFTESYDANGNLTQEAGGGTTTTYAYDADNEQTSTTTNTSPFTTVSTGYDATGNVTTQTNGLGKSTTYTYDPLNRVSTMTDPLNHTYNYGYDGNGNLLTSVDPMSRTTTYTYDAASELCAIDYTTTPAVCGSGTHDVTYSYNALGQRTAMTDSSGSNSSSYQYDSLGRLTQNTDANGNTLQYGYDLAGNLTSLTYPDNSKVTRGYDPANQLIDVRDWKGNDTHFSYDADGNLTSEGFPSSTNGAGASFSYNVADELTKIVDTRSAGANPFRWVFGSGRGALGQVSTATDRVPGMRHSYTYDALNRLTQDTRSNRTAQSWSYDAADELTGSADTGTGTASTTSTYTYNAGSQLTALQTTQGSSTLKNLTLSYNTMGDRTGQTDSVSNAQTTFGYNQADVLTSYANTKTGMSATYTYNGDGLRTTRTVNGTATTQVWDLAEGMPLLVQDGATKYVTGPGGLPIEQVDGSGTISYYVQDQLGSTRGLIDSSGNVLASFNFDAYGNPTGHTGTVTTPFGYAGQYTDAESGLQYLRARYYDPSTEQFLTVDPLVGATGEPYTYAGESPLNATDPAGLKDSACSSPTMASSLMCHPRRPPSAGPGLLLATGAVVLGAAAVGCAVLEPCGGVVASFVAAGAAVGGAGIATIAEEDAPAADTAFNACSDTIYAIGRGDDPIEAAAKFNYSALKISDWSPEKNDEWIQGIINAGARVYVASSTWTGNMWNRADGIPTVFAREISLLVEAGYKWSGDGKWLLPPK